MSLIPGLLFLFGLYFLWDACRSCRAGFSNNQWGRGFSRAEAPAAFWSVIAVEFVLTLIAFALAAYVWAH